MGTLGKYLIIKRHHFLQKAFFNGWQRFKKIFRVARFEKKTSTSKIMNPRVSFYSINKYNAFLSHLPVLTTSSTPLNVPISKWSSVEKRLEYSSDQVRNLLCIGLNDAKYCSADTSKNTRNI